MLIGNDGIEFLNSLGVEHVCVQYLDGTRVNLETENLSETEDAIAGTVSLSYSKGIIQITAIPKTAIKVIFFDLAKEKLEEL